MHARFIFAALLALPLDAAAAPILEPVLVWPAIFNIRLPLPIIEALGGSPVVEDGASEVIDSSPNVNSSQDVDSSEAVKFAPDADQSDADLEVDIQTLQTTTTIYSTTTTYHTIESVDASPTPVVEAAPVEAPGAEQTTAIVVPPPVPADTPPQPTPDIAATEPSPSANNGPASPAPEPSPSAVVEAATNPAPVALAAQPPAPAAGSTVSADTIRAIMPGTASCAGAPFPAECRTADQAAPLFAQSFTKWGINSKSAQAAVLALVALESGELKYQKAHFGDAPPGKGTRNMQYPNFNIKYATDALGAAAVAGKDAAAVLGALLADDATDFGSAAWFLATQCPGVLPLFASSPDQAWTQYLGSGCVGTTRTAERDAYWDRARKALA